MVGCDSVPFLYKEIIANGTTTGTVFFWSKHSTRKKNRIKKNFIFCGRNNESNSFQDMLVELDLLTLFIDWYLYLLKKLQTVIYYLYLKDLVYVKDIVLWRKNKLKRKNIKNENIGSQNQNIDSRDHQISMVDFILVLNLT